jgi:uncharacterized membrane protein YphA (DoxX/SURF4 family)
MRLLGVYVVLVIIGQAIGVGIGLFLDTKAPAISLPLALFLIFGVFVVAWPIAVRLSAPKEA